MPRLRDLLGRFFPNGTRPNESGQERPPFWPPDTFAFVSTVLSMSGFYVQPRYTAQWNKSCFFRGGYLEEVQRLGRAWKTGAYPNELDKLWRDLLSNQSVDISEMNVNCQDAAVKLMTIADEASEGIGFVADEENPFADYLLDQHNRQLIRKGRRGRWDLPFLPESLCWMVPPSEACVQPKTITPSVGCTLRSLSHHLALLPPVGELRTRWVFGTPAGRSVDQALNLLLVPFPFHIDGNCFAAESFSADDVSDRNFHFFALRQNWLEGPNRKIGVARLAEFLERLIGAAEVEVDKVHGLVLPEAALEASQVRPLAARLARRTNLELFISGYMSSEGRNARLPENAVYTSVFHNHKMLQAWSQAKHHRWRVDRNQITRYHLGHALDPSRNWWEKIEIKPRTCNFYVFRDGATLAALVCEDLARIEPVQAALRAVGPNLVVVLLMDGPQMEQRWPGKYATVLAEDPGSSVLTLTSFGMVQRSAMPGQQDTCQVGLWRERLAGAQELKLPKGRHGLLLTLSSAAESCRSLDGRPDREATIRLSLSGVRAVSHPDPPEWADTSA